MLTFPNGNVYKLVYIDTNVINDISKNTKLTGKNFLTNFITGDFAFVTSAFNIYEIFKTRGESRRAITNFLDAFPLMICQNYPQLVEFEKIAPIFDPQMILFATGPRPLFQTQISLLLITMETDSSFCLALNKMHNNFYQELMLWRSAQTPKSWLQNFNNNLLFSMNESFKLANNYFEVTELGKYKSLEVFSFVKNQFVYSTSKPIEYNSIIDAYNASFLPYVDVYITERTVSSWIENIAKKKLHYLNDIVVIKISDLYS